MAHAIVTIAMTAIPMVSHWFALPELAAKWFEGGKGIEEDAVEAGSEDLLGKAELEVVRSEEEEEGLARVEEAVAGGEDPVPKDVADMEDEGCPDVVVGFVAD